MAVDPAPLGNELDVLTRELGRLLRTVGRSSSEASGIEATAARLAAAVDALGAGRGKVDIRVERLIRARPVTAAASAFALGMAVGLLLMRH
jgi:ElaB/YqjD/DUF883 family membrane-anchored ribosome-binding protein